MQDFFEAHAQLEELLDGMQKPPPQRPDPPKLVPELLGAHPSSSWAARPSAAPELVPEVFDPALLAPNTPEEWEDDAVLEVPCSPGNGDDAVEGGSDAVDEPYAQAEATVLRLRAFAAAHAAARPSCAPAPVAPPADVPNTYLRAVHGGASSGVDRFFSSALGR